MSTAQRKDPYRNFRFQVEIGGVVIAGFSEVIIPDSTTDAIDYRAGDDPPYMRKLPGLTKYGALLLKTGVIDKMDLRNWRKQVEQGKMKDARKAIAVILMDEEGNAAARWEFSEAWPSKYKAPDLNAKGNDVVIETLEITFETMERTK
jgi:phage tail-like protein